MHQFNKRIRNLKPDKRAPVAKTPIQRMCINLNLKSVTNSSIKS